MEENDHSFLVVAESYCRYKAPAYYDDELLVRTQITELRRRSLRFGYEILRPSDGVIIAEGETGHIVIDAQGRVRSFPEAYTQLLRGAAAEASIHLSQAPQGRVPEGSGPA